jgi:hypothetical protein
VTTPSYRAFSAAISAVLICGVFSSPATGVAPDAAADRPVRADVTSAPRGDARLVEVKHSLAGTHTWYQQTYDGLDVHGGYYAVHDYGSAGVLTDDGRREVEGPVPAANRQAVDAGTLARVVSTVPGHPVRRRLVVLPSSGVVAWRVDTGAGRQAFVNASTGELVRVVSVLRRASGRGRVFDPNPVAALDRQDLRDERDTDSRPLRNAYRIVRLHRLAADSRELTGRWARITRAAGGLARSATRDFVYQRSDDRFEQVNAYHGVDSIQAYLQRLGFTGRTGVNAHAQKLHVNTFAQDNAYYNSLADRISFGTGGVDDAEDLDIVWHEYGHAMQDDQVPGFGTSNQATALGEGFSDYIAMAMSQHSDALSGRTRTSPTYACIGDWDATFYTAAPHCLRRTDRKLTMADYRRGDIHFSGQIWSRALRDINVALGVDEATRIIVEAQFSFYPRISYKVAAERTVAAAERLRPDEPTVATVVRMAFARRGIL